MTTLRLAGTGALGEEGFVPTGPALGRDLREGEPWAQLGRALFLLETSCRDSGLGDVRSGCMKMVAGAVGEGGMAVRFVAEYLARSPQAR